MRGEPHEAAQRSMSLRKRMGQGPCILVAPGGLRGVARNPGCHVALLEELVASKQRPKNSWIVMN